MTLHFSRLKQQKVINKKRPPPPPLEFLFLFPRSDVIGQKISELSPWIQCTGTVWLRLAWLNNGLGGTIAVRDRDPSHLGLGLHGSIWRLVVFPQCHWRGLQLVFICCAAQESFGWSASPFPSAGELIVPSPQRLVPLLFCYFWSFLGGFFETFLSFLIYYIFLLEIKR